MARYKLWDLSYYDYHVRGRECSFECDERLNEGDIVYASDGRTWKVDRSCLMGFRHMIFAMLLDEDISEKALKRMGFCQSSCVEDAGDWHLSIGHDLRLEVAKSDDKWMVWITQLDQLQIFVRNMSTMKELHLLYHGLTGKEFKRAKRS